MTVDELIERLQKSEGPSRELNLENARLHGVTVMRRKDDDNGNEEYTYWHYTSKIDDALSLVPGGWTAEINWREAFDKGSSCALHEFPEPCRRIPEKHPYVIQGATPAISICIAALRARSAGKG